MRRLERLASGRWGAAASDRRYVLGVFLLLAGLLACWCLVTPPLGGVDEDGHFFRVSAIAHGTLVEPHDASQGYGTDATRVFVPAAVAGLDEQMACRVGFHSPHAGCLVQGAAADAMVAVPSGAARYNPIYYTLISAGDSVLRAEGQLYLARGLSILICAGLLAVAFGAARRAQFRSAPLAILVGLTPMSLFLMGTINPNAVEIAAAIAVWTSGLSIVSSADPPRGRAWYGLAACASVMIMTRTISSLWLLVILGVLCLRAGRSRLRSLSRSRHLWTAAAIVVTAAGINLAWTVYSGVLDIAPMVGKSASHVGLVRALAETWQNSGQWWQQAVGVLGYLSIDLPAWAYLLFAAALGLFLLSGAPAGRRLAAGTALLAALISLIVAAVNFNVLGIWWQGRYSLPVLVGVPLLVAFGSGRARGTRKRSGGVPVLVVCAALLVTVDLVALREVLASATTPTTWARSHGGGWQPPVPAPVILVVSAVLLCALAWLCVAPLLAGSRPETPATATVTSTEPAGGGPWHTRTGSLLLTRRSSSTCTPIGSPSSPPPSGSW